MISQSPSALKPVDHPIERHEDLFEPFLQAEKPREAFRIGLEMERVGVHGKTCAPVPYEGERGVLGIMSRLIDERGWEPSRESENGPIIALTRGDAAVTLEPGAQLEFSGSPLPDMHQVDAELRTHLAEVAEVSEAAGIVWLNTGFHPFARQDELPWVPKARYAIMKNYLPKQGSGAWDMMRRTATVQLNLDYSDERDAMDKLLVGLKMAPIANALFANSPFREGQLTDKKSLRGEVWLKMDPRRSGLLGHLWNKPTLGYEDYVQWALDAGMFLIKRGERIIENTGQSFRDYLQNGYEGERATLADWRLHLNTLFPEARLKNTLELRPCDSLPLQYAGAASALWLGVLADSVSVAEAKSYLERFSFRDMESARPELVQRGQNVVVGGVSCQAIAEELTKIAVAGLNRRGRKNLRGQDETVFLEPLRALVQSGNSPADFATSGLSAGPVPPALLLDRTRLRLG
ncbi:MAG: glutamate-cysteine ligase family protein [Polyangiaceae bacterium]|nr:glutamate-cysteine ligase family protein [Polyangiaceae bacterium]